MGAHLPEGNEAHMESLAAIRGKSATIILTCCAAMQSCAEVYQGGGPFASASLHTAFSLPLHLAANYSSTSPSMPVPDADSACARSIAELLLADTKSKSQREAQTLHREYRSAAFPSRGFPHLTPGDLPTDFRSEMASCAQTGS
jgi:hypothetical protein